VSPTRLDAQEYAVTNRPGVETLTTTKRRMRIVIQKIFLQVQAQGAPGT
jgi:hypothetical protein